MKINLQKLFGPKDFRHHALQIILPVAIQSLITNFVNVLDNLMVGRIGTEEMTGVSVTNQLLTIFLFILSGALAAAGIFGSQFFGKRDWEGMRFVLRVKLFFGTLILAVFALAMIFGGKYFIGLFMQGEGAQEQAEKMLESGWTYMKIMLPGLIPFMLSQVLAGSLRESERTQLPMIAGIIAMLTNLVLNWVLIFGKLGLPALGAAGAALATVISRVTEFTYMLLGAGRLRGKLPYLKKVFSSLYIPGPLIKKILISAVPLVGNEILYSLAYTSVQQSLSLRSIYVMSALNISMTFQSLTQIAASSVGAAAGVLVGQRLGQSDYRRAKQEADWLSIIMLVSSSVLAILLFLTSGTIPQLYNTTEDVRSLSTVFMRLQAIALPMQSLFYCNYNILRAGGRTMLTFLSDAVMDCIKAALVFFIARRTALAIIPFYAITEAWYFVKTGFGYLLYKYARWMNNVVD